MSAGGWGMSLRTGMSAGGWGLLLRNRMSAGGWGLLLRNRMSACGWGMLLWTCILDFKSPNSQCAQNEIHKGSLCKYFQFQS